MINPKVVFYLYREDNQTKDNLTYFLNYGIDPSINYVFIINDYLCSIKIPELPNITVIEKENAFDLNSYRAALDLIKIDDYQYFIFLNSSCVGPFLPVYEKEKWHQLVIEGIDSTTKLVGPICEFPPDDLGKKCIENLKYIREGDQCIPFIHTYMFAVDRAGLEILKDYGVFTNDKISQDALILKQERLVSSAILNEGYNIKSFLLKFQNYTLAEKSNWNYKFWSPNKKTCPEIPNNYNSSNVHPLEVMFYKNIRRRHRHRKFSHSGISRISKKYLANYILWKSKH